MRMTRPLSCLALWLVGCASLPQPTPVDVTRAQTVYPTVTLEELTQDRKTYVKTCSGCHALHLPKEFSSTKWPALVSKMVVVEKVKLSGEQRQQIEEFLVAMAMAPPQ
jgi:hypothetical protein